MRIGHRSRSVSNALGAALCIGVVLAGARPALADIYVYWKNFAGTWQVGTVSTSWATFQSDDTSTTATTSEDEFMGGESHIAIVCDGTDCRLEVDCKSCHTTARRTSTFTRQAADRHWRTYFPQATVTVGTTPVAYGSGYVQQVSGRLVMLDRDRKPIYRLPADARLLRDTRTRQPLLIVYAGRAQPERIP